MKANETILLTISFESTDRNSIASYASHLATLHWDTKHNRCSQDGGAQWHGECGGVGQKFKFHNIDGDTVLLCPQTMADECKGEGLHSAKSVVAQWSIASGKGLWEAQTAIPAVVLVKGHDAHDENVTRCGAPFLMHMQSVDNAHVMDACHVTGTEPNQCTDCREVSWCSLGCIWGTYRFAYTAKVGGHFELQISLNGVDVPGSPFKPYVVDAGIFLPGFQLADAFKMMVVCIFFLGLIVVTIIASALRHHTLKAETRKRSQMLKMMSEESEAFMGLSAGDLDDDDDFASASAPQVPFAASPPIGMALERDLRDADEEHSELSRQPSLGEQRLPNPLNPMAPFVAPPAFRRHGQGGNESRPTSVHRLVNKIGIKL